MPHRRPKNSIVLGVVAALAVGTPFAVQALNSTPSDVRSASETSPSIETQIAEVVLSSLPDIVIPLKELTGLNLPDIRLRDLQLPEEIPIPGGGTIPLPPELTTPAAPGDIAAPTPVPDAVTPDRLGATVKEVTQDTPFSMVALTASNLESTISQVRAKLADGSWGEWITPDLIDTGSSDQATSTGKQGTEPVFVGETNAVQVLVTPKNSGAPTPTPAAESSPQPAAPADPAPAEAPAPETSPEAPQPLGYVPAAVSKPLREAALTANDVAAVLINPGSGPQDSNLADIATPTSVGGVRVISRKDWGANEGIRCGRTTYDDSLGGATVHHTAGSNNYTREESAGIVRGIYAYHAQTLGWCDIGYNVLVDRYGQIFEGRFGGLDRPVQGAHAGGFNENTVGVAMMGDFTSVAPPQATIESVGKFLGWRLKAAGLNPKGTTRMYSEGTQFSKYPIGAAVDLPIIFAHRDVGYTECPGNVGYTKMGQIRDIAAGTGGGGGGTPPTPNPGGGTNTGGGTGGGSSLDLTQHIPSVVNGILSLADSNPIAQKWLAEGGNRSKVGAALTGLLTTAAGQLYALFQNGAIFTSPNGGVFTVLGKIFETWKSIGAELSPVGLPISDEYAVPGGFRTDFERGSLVFDEATGVVTQVPPVIDQSGASAPLAPAAAPLAAESAQAPIDPASEAPVPIN
ncbi:cold-shock protein [Rhodococcus sp. ABRD24]|uniref:N-acetylmuramoyl-L-alanine amidase n=1 Tax=Rhodococcus sp. ABRD24 TaxID=2507582 RepID=UPI00103B597A|nr:N-acetylmuramoyl-L-alanine amidase [Rhodococcus sp. ABRD24]QBJ96683.1 cold-shock protein [Rhodococcus sp. ABRD24]